MRFPVNVMLLKQLLERSLTSANLLVCDPFRQQDQAELVKEVIGLANADVDGPRYILFGINAGAIAGSRIVGIADSVMTDLKKAHRLSSALIEPVLHLAFIYDRINNKLVGALEIDGCDDGPYVVRQDFSEKLSRGQSWIREGRQLRAADRTELAQISAHEAANQPTIMVGFNGRPDCALFESPVPDTSNPPSAREKRKVKKSLDFKKAIKDSFGTLNTKIMRMTHVREYGPDAEFDARGMDTLIGVYEEPEKEFADADNYYFFEQRAVKLNLTVCNKGAKGIKDVSIVLAFPRIPDLDVADRLYISPDDKRSRHEVEKPGYPEVQRRDDKILVRSSLGLLPPDRPEQAFESELRLAVGPTMRGKTVSIRYTLRGRNDQSLGKGCLKIRFSQVSA